jgi:hypothetical protein
MSQYTHGAGLLGSVRHICRWEIIVLHCATICFSVLIYGLLHCASMRFTVHHSASLFTTVLHCSPQFFTVHHSDFQCHTVLLCATLCHTVPHCATLCHTVPHCASFATMCYSVLFRVTRPLCIDCKIPKNVCEFL